jgi:phosphatidylinositol glycan class T
MRTTWWEPWKLLQLLLAAFTLGQLVNAASDSFDEQLTLRPLADGRLHTQFSFTLQSGHSGNDSTSIPIYSMVPRTLIHLAEASDAEEIHLAINAGRWDYQKWKEPGEEEMIGTGAEVWAKLRNSVGESRGSIK